jgi:hypothetical protein
MSMQRPQPNNMSLVFSVTIREPSYFAICSLPVLVEEFEPLILKSSVLPLLSISPTFYEQLLHQNPFAKKITNPNCKHIKGAQKKLSYEKVAHKILMKLTPFGA